MIDNKFLSPSLIGFDDIFNMMSRIDTSNKFPPHDIIKVDENTYTINIALAGFSRDEIEISRDANALTITADGAVLSMKESSTPKEYLHRGISKRAFTKTFALKDGIDVESAIFKDGILSVVMKSKPLKNKVEIISIN